MIHLLIVFFIVLCIVGVLLWGISQIPNIPQIVKVVVYVIIAIILLLWLLNFVNSGGIGNMRL
jgi:hypothetical protein